MLNRLITNNRQVTRLFCEDHITRSLNVDNACALLASALAKEEQMAQRSNSSGSSFVERCVHFIGDNASECFQTTGFLRLSKDALIRLVSSDHLALEEVEIWRAVLTWARHQVIFQDIYFHYRLTNHLYSLSGQCISI